MTRVRLTGRAMVDGAVREPGYEFELPVGAEGGDLRGPHTTRRLSHDRIDVKNDSKRIVGELEDVPLYEPVAAKPEPESKPEGE